MVAVASRMTFQWDEQVVNTLVRGQNGIAGREVRERGERIKTRAQELVGVDTGRLRASIYVRNFAIMGNPSVLIGFGTDYGVFHHEGTGLWGPTHSPIRPKTASVLVFTPKGGGGKVYARSVRGSKPNPFLRDAIRAGADPQFRASVASALAARDPAGGADAGRTAAQIGDHDWSRNAPGGSGGWSRDAPGGAPASGRTSGLRRVAAGVARVARRVTGWGRHVGPGARSRRGR